jgi:broad specificity phosphatase PhoE
MVEAPDVPVSKWPRRLVIVRHAESEANLRRLYLEREASQDIELGLGIRDADVPLTERGWKQAEATGRALNADDPFAVVHVSPYRRTQETAERLVSQLVTRPRLVLEETRSSTGLSSGPAFRPGCRAGGPRATLRAALAKPP